jgi:fucose permease
MGGATTLGLGLLPLAYNVALLIAGTVLLIAYFLHSRRVSNPILDFSLLSIPTFRHSLTSALLFRIGMGATPFLLPLLLQVGFGKSPFQSGLITFASAIGAATMKFVATPTLRHFGFRRVLLSNTIIAAAFLALPALFTPTTPVSIMTGLLLIGGFFRSLQFTATNALSYADITQLKMSHATTLTSVAQQVSLSVGVSIGAVALEFATHFSDGAIVAGDFWFPFLTIGTISLLAIIPLVKLKGDAGEELSGHRLQRATPDPVTIMRERG